jgi:hypothetical protein
MSNIHANLIKNATDMQSQLLEFSHQLSNLSLKSLDNQNAFKMNSEPTFTAVPADSGNEASGALNSDSGFISVTGMRGGQSVSVVFKIDAGSIANSGGNYDLRSYINTGVFDTPSNLAAVPEGNIKTGVTPGSTSVSFQLESASGPTMTVNIPSTGVPEDPTASGAPTLAQQSVAKAMAVVAMNLRGVGVGVADIQEIFKNGITPTSLAAVESQLKGHHDAVLQLSLESLSRVTNILQKIAQKLGS